MLPDGLAFHFVGSLFAARGTDTYRTLCATMPRDASPDEAGRFVLQLELGPRAEPRGAAHMRIEHVGPPP